MSDQSGEFEKRLSNAAYVFATETRVAFNHDMSNGAPIDSSLGIGFHAGAHYGVAAVIDWLESDSMQVLKISKKFANLIRLHFQSNGGKENG